MGHLKCKWHFAGHWPPIFIHWFLSTTLFQLILHPVFCGKAQSNFPILYRRLFCNLLNPKVRIKYNSKRITTYASPLEIQWHFSMKKMVTPVTNTQFFTYGQKLYTLSSKRPWESNQSCSYNTCRVYDYLSCDKSGYFTVLFDLWPLSWARARAKQLFDCVQWST